jgi:hypothetical protein
MPKVPWWIRKLNFLFPHGFYAGPIRHLVQSLEDHLPNRYFIGHVRRKLDLKGDDPAPAWVSEVYQLVSLILASVLIAAAPHSNSAIKILMVLFAVIRLSEMFVFVLAWIFVHRSHVRSHRRSLAGFMVNFLEVVVFYGLIYVCLGLVKGPAPVSTALYTSIRTSVTIGPVSSTLEPPDCPYAGFVIGSQMVLSFTLFSIVVANAVGAIQRSSRPR